MNGMLIFFVEVYILYYNSALTARLMRQLPLRPAERYSVGTKGSLRLSGEPIEFF